MASCAVSRDPAAPARGYDQGAAPAGHCHAEGQSTLTGQLESAAPQASVQHVVTCKQEEQEQHLRSTWTGGEPGQWFSAGNWAVSLGRSSTALGLCPEQGHGT